MSTCNSSKLRIDNLFRVQWRHRKNTHKNHNKNTQGKKFVSFYTKHPESCIVTENHCNLCWNFRTHSTGVSHSTQKNTHVVSSWIYSDVSHVRGERSVQPSVCKTPATQQLLKKGRFPVLDLGMTGPEKIRRGEAPRIQKPRNPPTRRWGLGPLLESRSQQPPTLATRLNDWKNPQRRLPPVPPIKPHGWKKAASVHSAEDLEDLWRESAMEHYA